MYKYSSRFSTTSLLKDSMSLLRASIVCRMVGVVVGDRVGNSGVSARLWQIGLSCAGKDCLVFYRRGTRTRRPRRPSALWPKAAQANSIFLPQATQANLHFTQAAQANSIMAGGSAGQQHYGQKPKQRRQTASFCRRPRMPIYFLPQATQAKLHFAAGHAGQEIPFPSPFYTVPP